MRLLAYWLVRRKRQGKPALIEPGLFKFPHFTTGVSQQLFQQITLGGAMIALPIFLQMTLEYNAMQAGLSLAPLSLSMFAVAMLAGRRTGKRRPANIILVGFALTTAGMALIIPFVPRVHSGWALLVPLLITGSGLGCWCPSSTTTHFPRSRMSESARQPASTPRQGRSDCHSGWRWPEESCSRPFRCPSPTRRTRAR